MENKTVKKGCVFNNFQVSNIQQECSIKNFRILLQKKQNNTYIKKTAIHILIFKYAKFAYLLNDKYLIFHLLSLKEWMHS